MARPKAIAGELVLQTRVPLFDGAALDALARATGEAKASHLRRALAQYLATFDLSARLACRALRFVAEPC